MGFENTLANLPGGLGAFLAQKDYNENVAPRAQLQRAQGLMGIIAQAQAQHQRQQGMAREEALRGALSKLPPGATPEMVTQAITPYVGADTLMRTLQGSQDRAATRDAANTNLQATRESRLAEIEQRGAQQLEGIRLAASERRITQQEADARERTTREMILRLGARLRPEREERVHPVVGVNPEGNQVVNWARPSEGTQTLETRPTGTASLQFKDENIGTRQIRNKWSTETKAERDALVTANKYDEFRSTGDNAQAMIAAENTLRMAMRGGSQRFKGEADKILGTGYGGGSVPERIANFLSTEATGTPTSKTVAKLDALMSASRDVAIENFAERTKFYANQAKGSNWSLRKSLGDPNIFGNVVVFPDGTRAKYSNAQDAQKDAARWVQENP